MSTTYHVTVLSNEDGRYWSEGTHHYTDRHNAESAMSALASDGYAAVLWSGDNLLDKMGISVVDAKRYGTGTINRLKYQGHW